MEKCLLGSSFLYVFPAKIFQPPTNSMSSKASSKQYFSVEGSQHPFPLHVLKQMTDITTCVHTKLPCDKPCHCWDYTDQDNTMVLLSLTNFRWSSPFTGSFISTCFRTRYCSNCLWSFEIKISARFVLLLQPGNFLLKGLADMILKHKIRTDKKPVFVTLRGRLETYTGE